MDGHPANMPEENHKRSFEISSCGNLTPLLPSPRHTKLHSPMMPRLDFYGYGNGPVSQINSDSLLRWIYGSGTEYAQKWKSSFRRPELLQPYHRVPANNFFSLGQLTESEGTIWDQRRVQISWMASVSKIFSHSPLIPGNPPRLKVKSD
jgi:hypothetical protein